jgi:glycosyltransferase involved in cell wall biosynthesis
METGATIPSTVSISAVITTYQSVECVESALDSVYGQSVLPSEVLVCDDGSTDGTSEKAGGYSDVKVLELPHSGMVATSRNRGIASASSDWVAFLDGDDYWEPQHLEWFMEALRTEADPFDLFSGNGTRVRQTGESSPYFLEKDQLPGGTVDIREFLRVRPVITSTAIARRTRVVEEKGFPEDRSSVAAEDFDLWYRLLRRGGLFYDSRPHVRYLEHAQGLTRKDHGLSSRRNVIYVLGARLAQETGDEEKALLREALVRDHLTLALLAASSGHLFLAARSVYSAIRTGLRPFFEIVSKVITGKMEVRRRIKRYRGGSQ